MCFRQHISENANNIYYKSLYIDIDNLLKKFNPIGDKRFGQKYRGLQKVFEGNKWGLEVII